MPNFSQLRTTMVDTQVRPSDVTKFPIIQAMLNVPREAFVPASKRDAAYVGEHIDLGRGRVVLDPRVFAKMLEELDIQSNELVLDLGAGLGYSSAVIAHMAEAVIAVEDDADMAAAAANNLMDAGVDNVVVECATLADGAPQHGPYDVVILQGAVETLPDAVLSQVKSGGRIACIFLDGALGIVKLGYNINGEINWRPSFNATAPVLSGFEAEKTFAL
ncbi:protein-L-isoaspartate O-methyltransferase family protein [Celeribacter marinus]|uniref:Protein-L-isoaspartate O-methyltransferase n=1 Tax=Celeribacter marinus TaxID=1397108 RepID=A0A0P0ACG1_9RHOB|nr:protein-L-isoaspartate O-methyltransferase [Celeribacter marinus]ALI56518.1 protein-L-isoaspartate O-methyltransferase [Celeribacter marinus]SFK40884.1 protein-L-isoaspartate(D-aspartate) O-methyltransferase [Celeribacter marinus]